MCVKVEEEVGPASSSRERGHGRDTTPLTRECSVVTVADPETMRLRSRPPPQRRKDKLRRRLHKLKYHLEKVEDKSLGRSKGRSDRRHHPGISGALSRTRHHVADSRVQRHDASVPSPTPKQCGLGRDNPQTLERTTLESFPTN